MADDCDAWVKYPQHRRWFNKLDLSMRLGYECGPCGLPPMSSMVAVVRPIYNLSGMGVGARKQVIEAGDFSAVEPGYFWNEWFDGPQTSVAFRWTGSEWEPLSAWVGERGNDELFRFSRWVRSSHHGWVLPSFFDELSDVGEINVEFIGDKPIEVHLRESPDPDLGSEIIPIWDGDDIPDGSRYIEAADDADGFLPIKRLGFIIID